MADKRRQLAYDEEWLADYSGDGTRLAPVHAAAAREATLKSSSTVTDAGSVNVTAVTGLGWASYALFLLSVTAAATGAGDTLDVYIDTSPDGGTTWVNAVHFTQVIGNGGAKKEWAVVSVSGAPAATATAVTSDAASGVVRPAVLGDALRVRHTVVDGGSAAQSFTFSVTALLRG